MTMRDGCDKLGINLHDTMPILSDLMHCLGHVTKGQETIANVSIAGSNFGCGQQLI
jgi:hypothetical protein